VRNSTVCRNYAEALLATARAHDQVERCGELLDVVAGVVAADPKLRSIFESPRVLKADKKQLIERALKDIAPPQFIRFLQAIVQRGRQGLLSQIAEEYEKLVDRHLNRVHAVVTTARPVDDALGVIVAERLSKVFAKTVVPHFRTEPAILGGLVVRVGDQVFDGSLRRKLKLLRNRMLHAPLGFSESAR
jgi:F-type H+-transporting ATPase subunit delta